MANSETTHVEPTPPAAREQVTSKIPNTAPVKEKNPKRVAAGKAVAARTKKAREEQKKAAEAAGFVPTQPNKALPNEQPTASTSGSNEDRK